MPIETNPYAFLSYSRKDEGVVRQFAAYLAQEEIPPWVDNQLEFGERWEDVIMERLQGCTVFLSP
jgi:TIR domain